MQPDQLEKCDKFEKGLGVVLKNAWQHVEAVQTTDVQTLVHLIGDVLNYALGDSDFIVSCIDKGDLHQRQEIMIFYYIVAVMRQLDYLQQDRYATDILVPMRSLMTSYCHLKPFFTVVSCLCCGIEIFSC